MRSTGAVIVFDAAPATAPFTAATEKDDFDEDEAMVALANAPSKSHSACPLSEMDCV